MDMAKEQSQGKNAYNDFRLSLAYEVKKLYWKTHSTNPEQQTTLQSLPQRPEPREEKTVFWTTHPFSKSIS